MVFNLYKLLLDVTEVSYNNGRSRLLSKNQTILEDIEFTSDSDYNYNSDKKNVKKKKKSKKSKKSTKSRKNTNKKMKKNKLIDESDLTITITLGKDKSDSFVKKVITSPSTNEDKLNSSTINRYTEDSSIIEKHFGSNANSDIYVEKIFEPSIKTNNLNSINIKRHMEDSIVKKHFKSNGETESSVFNSQGNNNDHLLLFKKNDSVYNNTDINSLKPLPLLKLEPFCKLSSSSGTHQYNEKIQAYTVPTVQFSSLPTVNIVPILNYETGNKYSTIEQPTLEPIRIEQKADIVEGMFKLLFLCSD